MVNAAKLRIIPKASVEEFIDLIAYVFEAEGPAAVITNDDAPYTAIIIAYQNEITAYVIPPENKELFLSELKHANPCLEFDYQDLGTEDINIVDYDPLANYLPTTIRPATGSEEAEEIKPAPGTIQSG